MPVEVKESQPVLSYQPQPKFPPYRYRILTYAVIAMIAITLLPIWTVWHVGSWESTGTRGIFWNSVINLPMRKPNLLHALFIDYSITFGITALLGGLIGFLSVYLDRRLIRENARRVN